MDTLTTVRYIDANKLMSDLCLRSCYNREHRCDNDSAANEDLKVVEMIKEMPTIDAEHVRHGRWVFEIYSYSTPKCSCCGWHMPYSEDSTLDARNYCPNCGAKMDLKEEDK